MLYYDRINISEGIDVNKIDVSKMWCLSLHCTKNYIFFFQMLWKGSLSKKISLEYVLYCIIRKNDKENERWNFSKKIHGNMTYSSNVLKRWSFIKTALEYNLFLLLGKMRFLFPENIIFFLPMENERWSFSKNTWKCDVFCMLGKDGFLFLAFEITLLSKKQKWSFPQIIHLKMTFLALLKNIHPRKDDIAILNWHSRKSSNDSLYFYRDCFKCFHISLSNENKPENLL